MYLRDEQLDVLFKTVQESLQRVGVGRVSLPCSDFWKSSMLVINLRQNLNKEQKVIQMDTEG